MKVNFNHHLSDNQQTIFNYLVKNPPKYNFINASRQSGKSLIVKMLMIYFGTMYPSVQIIYGSPTHKLNKKMFSEITDLLVNTGVIIKSNKSDMQIHLFNGSVISFISLKIYENIRGFTPDYLFIDEFAYIHNSAWGSIKPVVAARHKAKVICISTPRGMDDNFYKFCMLGQDESNDRYSYNFIHYSDNPNYDLSEISDAKEVLPENVFLSEYEGQFVADYGNVFKNIMGISTIEEWIKYDRTKQYYAGLDWGKDNDSTILTIINSLGEVCRIFTYNAKNCGTWDNIKLTVLNDLKMYPYCKVYVESNNGTVNSPLAEDFIRDYRSGSATGFTTSNDSKNDIIEKLNLSMNQSKIKLPSKTLCPALHSELNTFTFAYSKKSRKVLYHAREGFHDDIVMSLAIANHAYIKHSKTVTFEQGERKHIL